MSLSANNFTAYMSEKVSVTRWDRFWRYFVLLLLIYPAVKGSDQLFDHPGDTVRHSFLSFGVALLIPAIGYWRERYGDRFEKGFILFLILVTLVLLAVIVWHEVERHWRSSLSQSNSTVANVSRSNSEPTTNSQRLTL